jgi:hypothetical protein
LPNGQKYNQDESDPKAISELQSERSRFARRKTLVEFATRMHDSICHNGTKGTNALNKANLIRAPHAVYSRNLSRYEFWPFGMLEHRMATGQLQSPKEMSNAVTV